MVAGVFQPYSQWSAEKKTAIAMQVLHSLTTGPRDGSQCSTTYPGPMSLEQMQFLANSPGLFKKEPPPGGN